MDLNFSGDLWGMPVNLVGQLTQEPSIRMTDLLPLIVVFIGGLITYYVTSSVERNKRQYELKAQIYFEATDILTGMLTNQLFDIMTESKDDETSKKIKKELMQRKITEEITKLSVYLFKISIIGSQETARIFGEIYEKSDKLKSNTEDFDKIADELDKLVDSLTISMRNDLHIES
jgi:hypothetical protein